MMIFATTSIARMQVVRRLRRIVLLSVVSIAAVVCGEPVCADELGSTNPANAASSMGMAKPSG